MTDVAGRSLPYECWFVGKPKKHPAQIVFGVAVCLVGVYLNLYGLVAMSSVLMFAGIGIGLVGFCVLFVGLINFKDGR